MGKCGEWNALKRKLERVSGNTEAPLPAGHAQESRLPLHTPERPSPASPCPVLSRTPPTPGAEAQQAKRQAHWAAGARATSVGKPNPSPSQQQRRLAEVFPLLPGLPARDAKRASCFTRVFSRTGPGAGGSGLCSRCGSSLMSPNTAGAREGNPARARRSHAWERRGAGQGAVGPGSWSCEPAQGRGEPEPLRPAGSRPRPPGEETLSLLEGCPVTT